MRKKHHHPLYNRFLWSILCVGLLVAGNSQGVSAYQQQEMASQQSDSLYRQAMHFVEQQNLPAALLVMEGAAAGEPDRIEYWELLLAIHQEMGQASGAANALEQLIRLRPDERQYYMDRAYLLAYQEQYEQALEVYAELSERLGKDELVYTATARVYQMLDRPQDAIRELEALLDTGEGQLIAYVMLGDLYADTGEHTKALATLDAGRARVGDQPLLNFSHAEVLRQTGRVNEAYTHLLQAFESHMFDLDYKAGVLYSVTGVQPAYEAEQITALADQLVRQYPVSVKSHAVRADIYAQYNLLQEAKASYLAALELDQQVPMVWQQLISLSLFLGQMEDAQHYAEQAAQLFPDEPDLLFYAGHTQQVAGNTEQAREYMEQALNGTAHKESQFLSQIFASLGSIYHDLEMYSASDVAHEEALVLDSLDAFTLNNYAYYLALRNDKLDRALEMSGLAVQLQPDYATFEDTHAWVLFQREEHEEALRWIQRAIRHSEESSATLLEHYGDILYKNGQVRDAVSQWKKARRYASTEDGSADRLNQKVNARSLID